MKGDDAGRAVLFVADVHGSFDELRRVVSSGEPVFILGDLLNFVDYRTGEGIAADVFGPDFASAAMQFRKRGDFAASRALWRERAAGREAEVRSQVRGAIERQYLAMQGALEGGVGVVTHGNVDIPALLESHLPEGFRYVGAGVVDHEGLRIGLVGGGTTTGLNAAGEIGEEDLARRLGELGPVDILATHVPPAVDALRRDVITGRLEGGSEAITDYLYRHQPPVHYFGDIHQPQASRWRLGRTTCVNVGYFRATARAVRHV